jgi:hypothetical protein
MLMMMNGRWYPVQSAAHAFNQPPPFLDKSDSPISVVDRRTHHHLQQQQQQPYRRNDDRREIEEDGKPRRVIFVEDSNMEDSNRPNYVCLLPVSIGDCKSYQNKWYFNRYAGRCEMFFYGGCGGNANRFENLQLCIQTCVEPMQQRPLATMTNLRQESPQQSGLPAEQPKVITRTTTAIDQTKVKDEAAKVSKVNAVDPDRQQTTTVTPSDGDDDVIYVTSPVYIPMTRDDLDAAGLSPVSGGGEPTGNRIGAGSEINVRLVPSSPSATSAAITQQPTGRTTSGGQQHHNKQPETVRGHGHVVPVTSESATEHVVTEPKEDASSSSSGDLRTSYVASIGLSKPYIAIVTVLGIVGLAVISLVVIISVHMCRKVRHSKKADIVEDVIKTSHHDGSCMYNVDMSHVIYNETSPTPSVKKRQDEKL